MVHSNIILFWLNSPTVVCQCSVPSENITFYLHWILSSLNVWCTHSALVYLTLSLHHLSKSAIQKHIHFYKALWISQIWLYPDHSRNNVYWKKSILFRLRNAFQCSRLLNPIVCNAYFQKYKLRYIYTQYTHKYHWPGKKLMLRDLLLFRFQMNK